MVFPDLELFRATHPNMLCVRSLNIRETYNIMLCGDKDALLLREATHSIRSRRVDGLHRSRLDPKGAKLYHISLTDFRPFMKSVHVSEN